MPRSPKSVLEPEDRENLPADALLAPEDPYFERERRLEALVTYEGLRLKPRQRTALRHLADGKSQAEVVRLLKTTHDTVKRWREEGTPYLHALQSLERLRQGPNLASRRDMLHRIALRHEMNDPGISIQALRELNKLAGDYKVPDNTPSAITINIDGTLLPRTSLDTPQSGLPAPTPALIENDA